MGTFSVPARALFFQAGIASIMVMAGDFENLLAAFNVAAWTFYLQAVSCLLVLRWKEPDLPRPVQRHHHGYTKPVLESTLMGCALPLGNMGGVVVEGHSEHFSTRRGAVRWCAVLPCSC